MTGQRLRAFAHDWILPGLIGLAGAAVIIAGAEVGGLVGWLFIGLAAFAMVAVVVWAVRSAYSDYPFGWPDDDDA